MLGGFAALVGPDQAATLDRHLLEGRRLHLRTGKAALVARLFPWSRMNELVTMERLINGDVRLFQRGRSIPLSMCVHELEKGHELAPGAVASLCAGGASIVLNKMGRIVPRIAVLEAELARRWQAGIWTNAYASFQKESAFKAHHDGHGVLVLQLQGRKLWRCYGACEVDPVENRSYANGPDRPVEWEGVLEPGDLLFLPRGDVHMAWVQGPQSLHLTFGISPALGMDVLKWLASGKDDAVARQDVPAFAPPERLAAQETALRRLGIGRLEGLDLASFLSGPDNRPKAAPGLNLGLSDLLDEGTEIHPMVNRRLALPAQGPVAITLARSKHQLSDTERAVYALLQDRNGMDLAGLLAALPDRAADLRQAVAGLAAKGMVRLLEPAV